MMRASEPVMDLELEKSVSGKKLGFETQHPYGQLSISNQVSGSDSNLIP